MALLPETVPVATGSSWRPRFIERYPKVKGARLSEGPAATERVATAAFERGGTFFDTAEVDGPFTSEEPVAPPELEPPVPASLAVPLTSGTQQRDPDDEDESGLERAPRLAHSTPIVRFRSGHDQSSLSIR